MLLIHTENRPSDLRGQSLLFEFYIETNHKYTTLGEEENGTLMQTVHQSDSQRRVGSSSPSDGPASASVLADSGLLHPESIM